MKIVKAVLNFFLLLIVSLTTIILYYPGKIAPDQKIDEESVTSISTLPISQADTTSSDDSANWSVYPEVPILMYHYIRDPKALPEWDSVGRNLSVSPKNLDKQISELLTLGYEIVTLDQLLSERSAKKRAVLTFDDGYADFYSNAYPVLKKYNVKATIFVIINRIDVAGYLSASQIQELSAGGIEIGSHSVNHPNLTNTSLANVNKQLSESKDELESIIAKPVMSFCYPSGKYNEETIEAVDDNNYYLATTTDYRVADITEDNPLALPRLRIKNTTSVKAILKKLVVE